MIKRKITIECPKCKTLIKHQEQVYLLGFKRMECGMCHGEISFDLLKKFKEVQKTSRKVEALLISQANANLEYKIEKTLNPETFNRVPTFWVSLNKYPNR